MAPDYDQTVYSSESGFILNPLLWTYHLSDRGSFVPCFLTVDKIHFSTNFLQTWWRDVVWTKISLEKIQIRGWKQGFSDFEVCFDTFTDFPGRNAKVQINLHLVDLNVVSEGDWGLSGGLHAIEFYFSCYLILDGAKLNSLIFLSIHKPVRETHAYLIIISQTSITEVKEGRKSSCTTSWLHNCSWKKSK